MGVAEFITVPHCVILYVATRWQQSEEFSNPKVSLVKYMKNQ